MPSLGASSGWSIDASPTATLVTNPLAMAIEQRKPAQRTVIYSDQGTEFTSCAVTKRTIDSGLVFSMGSVGDCYANAVIESFWSPMQVELLDREKWRRRVDRANAIVSVVTRRSACLRRSRSKIGIANRSWRGLLAGCHPLGTTATCQTGCWKV
jgi:transposase InsO family protein